MRNVTFVEPKLRDSVRNSSVDTFKLGQHSPVDCACVYCACMRSLNSYAFSDHFFLSPTKIYGTGIISIHTRALLIKCVQQ